MAGLYLHIPYCSSKCYYCDFYSGSGLGHESEYIAALSDEYRLRIGEIKEDFKTVYIGGGTPSSLSRDNLVLLLDSVSRMVNLNTIEEYTVEVNPEDVREDLLKTLKAHGVNRVSMGIQSLNDDELAAVGRRHTAMKAIESARLVAQYFSNYSFDLIFGLPGQSIESLKSSLDQLIELRPPHLSVYLLSYEPGTRLHARLSSCKVQETDEETSQQMYRLIADTLAQAGYTHYEISNYALPGYQSRHNTSYWFSVPYLGLGASAHSFDGTVRRYNPSRLPLYLDKISSGLSAATVDDEDDDNRLNDIIITRLRTARGLGQDDMTPTQYSMLRPTVDKMIDSGLLEVIDGRVRIPETHWLVSDNILRQLIV